MTYFSLFLSEGINYLAASWAPCLLSGGSVGAFLQLLVSWKLNKAMQVHCTRCRSWSFRLRLLMHGGEVLAATWGTDWWQKHCCAWAVSCLCRYTAFSSSGGLGLGCLSDASSPHQNPSLPRPTAWNQTGRPQCGSLSSKSPLPGGCCRLPKDTAPEVSVLYSWKASKPLCEHWNENLAGTRFHGGTRWLLCLQIDGIAAAGMTSLGVL